MANYPGVDPRINEALTTLTDTLATYSLGIHVAGVVLAADAEPEGKEDAPDAIPEGQPKLSMIIDYEGPTEMSPWMIAAMFTVMIAKAETFGMSSEKVVAEYVDRLARVMPVEVVREFSGSLDMETRSCKQQIRPKNRRERRQAERQKEKPWRHVLVE